MPRKTSKSASLIEAAKELFNGPSTRLADIPQQVNVPLGNVYAPEDSEYFEENDNLVSRKGKEILTNFQEKNTNDSCVFKKAAEDTAKVFNQGKSIKNSLMGL
jgi:hypothetical protein